MAEPNPADLGNPIRDTPVSLLDRLRANDVAG
jgi:hypothetical protein